VQSLKDLLEKLPPDLQQEVIDFADFLLDKQRMKQKDEFKFDWRGALRDLRNKYTSVELQHKILEWWGADVSSRH